MAELTFECPACFGHTEGKADWELRATYTGEFSFGIEILDGEVCWEGAPVMYGAYPKRFYCGNCGYTLTDPKTQEPITEDEEVIDWLKKYDSGEIDGTLP